MLEWDKEIVRRCRKAGIQVALYKRYVDNIFNVMRPINPGFQYDSKREKLYFSRERELEDIHKSETQMTAEIMASIANSINPAIQVTLDYPEKHPDG